MDNQVSTLTDNKCERTFASGFWRSSWRSLSKWCLRLNLRSLLTLARARVSREAAAFLGALRLATSNNRTYLGLLLICCAGPLSGVAYLQLNPAFIEGTTWYYNSLYWLFYVLCPHIQVVLTVTGAFLLFPQDSKVAYFLAIPAAYHTAKIMWLIQVTTDQEIRQAMPYGFWIAGGSGAILWLFMFDYFMTLHFHKRAGSYARAEGVLAADDIDNETKVRVALRELQNAKSF